MRILWSHAGQIIDTYKGEVPLHHFLKKYFREYPKLGSRDRRALSDAAYAWYRSSKAIGGAISREEQFKACLFLCGLQPKAFQGGFPSSWNPLFYEPVAKKLACLKAGGIEVDLQQIFPHETEFSDGITPKEWTGSLLRQPLLFLRIRKKKEWIDRMLQQHTITGQWLTETCLALPNGTNIEKIIPADYYVVQDVSSQATGTYFQPSGGEAWWDCCCGGGGKSLLLKDLQPSVVLTVSDVREPILQNLRLRFRQYGLQPPEAMCIDMADPDSISKSIGNRRFDAILCDVPCTGSGTWARTPEQLYFFTPDMITSYSNRQQSILRNASRFIREQGRIIYITCSVFREENEKVVEKIAAEEGLVIQSMQLFNGIGIKADSLFAAVLKRNV